MELFEQKRYSAFLEKLADSLDLTEEQYLFAKENYEALGNFLNEPGTLLSKYNPEIMTQGSIKLGTCVKPIKEEDEFDVDMTCKLHSSFPAKQSDFKKLLKTRLCEDTKYAKMLDNEKRRCWRLKYPEKYKFHLDLVPALKDDYNWLLAIGVPLNLAEHAICITDNENDYYNDVAYSESWPKSNTEGYARWFLDIMKIQADQIRAELKTKLLLERVEDVPDYKVRTPLQRVIQLMKRHRDTNYENNEDKPISIIITTLAAKAYEKVLKTGASMLFYDIMVAILNAMPEYILKSYGKWYIQNPVDPKENFADKWNENNSKAKIFFEWLSKFKFDFQQSFAKGDIQSAINFIKPNYGSRAISEASEAILSQQQVLLERSFNKPKVQHQQSPIWPINLGYNTKINCKYKRLGKWDWIDLNSHYLPKDCELMFTASTNVPDPFSVFWQVVNTGKEAEAAHDLRGSIFSAFSAGRGGLQQKEHTKYKGAHWIECFIVKNGVCVSRTGEFIINVE